MEPSLSEFAGNTEGSPGPRKAKSWASSNVESNREIGVGPSVQAQPYLFPVRTRKKDRETCAR